MPGDATAVVLNFAATGLTADGWLTVYPVAPLPVASSLNFVAGQTVANLAVVKVHMDQKVRVTNTGDPGGPVPGAGFVHIVIDETGWFK